MRVVTIAIGTAIGLWLFLGLVLACVGRLIRPHPADVAVVLGNAVHRNGSPSARLAARLDSAHQCYSTGRCRLIFVSGGIDAAGTNEATSMRAWLVRKGVPSDRIIVDAAGNDTWATARHASEFMRGQRLASAIVVTQYFHLPRTILALERFGVAEVSGMYPSFWDVRDFYSIAREVPAFVWYAVRPR
jgi:vancomycin permeability regulator SanA